jgi:NFU1 iron-sulfur cluster scaffold homolog, mitochondrial
MLVSAKLATYSSLESDFDVTVTSIQFILISGIVNTLVQFTMVNHLGLLLVGSLFTCSSLAFAPAPLSFVTRRCSALVRSAAASDNSAESSSSSSSSSTVSKTQEASSQTPTPVLNGKMVLPYKVLAGGLQGQKVAAVFAVVDRQYQRGQPGWVNAVHVAVSQDLDTTLRSLLEKHGSDRVANIRALSFAFPQPGAMQQVSMQWKDLALAAGAMLDPSWHTDDDTLNYVFDEEEDDDDDEFEDIPSMLSEGTIISPFDSSGKGNEVAIVNSADEPMVFNAENVDKVLNEVRPYLIADGGNVVVTRVDEENKNVYLKLEGACGSCSSSTVTMQMGIEKTLRENFKELNQVLQVDSDPDAGPKELTWKAVEEEVNRLSSAISAMGGQVELLEVDVSLGVVKLKYRGPNKVKQGLEMAIQDIPFVNRVETVMGDD